MRLISIWIDNYKIYNDNEIVFSKSEEVNVIQSKLFSKLSINTLVGSNGSGKSTIMGFIASIFHNLERYHTRIESDFRLLYEIDVDEENVIVQLEKIGPNIFFKNTQDTNNKLLLEWEIKKKAPVRREYQREYKYTCSYDEIRKYLPKNIIVSCFEIDEMYPDKRTYNYVGDRIVKLHKVGATTISTGYGLGITEGIIKLYSIFANNKIARNKLENALDIKFSNRVKVLFEFIYFEDFIPQYSDYDEEVMSQLFKKYSTHFNIYDFNEFTEFIFSEELWGEYIVGIEDDSACYLDILSFIEADPVNSEILLSLSKGKSTYINEIYIEKWGKQLPFNKMSSGEKIFLYRMISILSHICSGSIVLLDEPEVHLNEKWSRQLVSVLSLLFSGFQSHILVATHSHLFINNLFKENVMLFENGSVRNPRVPIFLASPHEIYRELNGDQIYQNISENLVLEALGVGNKDELLQIYNELGESVYKYLVFKMLKNENGDRNVENQ
ncbi:AAA family ATPase [Fusibacter sp. JL216-2]|uniref:AAA family ATPase n=1 Tax=Fusibacter sp. JL216-2 TaxID=3071453 RepID=UPI003D349145